MEKARSWYVESKTFEMLIKGGNSGLRIVERGKRKQDSIFLQREEIAWLVGTVEGVLDVDTSEVFWDPTSAGYPRVLVQRRSNRHGNYILIEEFERSNRRGSILIPEGRYGQGWIRLVAELRSARSNLWKDRVFRVNKTTLVDPARSFAEVVGRPKSLETEGKVLPVATVEEPTAKRNIGGRAQILDQTTSATSPLKIAAQIGKPKAIAVAGGHVGDVPVMSQVQAKEKGVMGNGNKASVLIRTLQNPVNSGMEAPIGDRESDRHGHASVHGGFSLQDFTQCLLDIRDELTMGLKRVETAFQMLELKERVDLMGSGEDFLPDKKSMDTVRRNEGVGWSKPKKKEFRRKKTQPGLLGPKPSKVPGKYAQNPGSTGHFSYRIISWVQTQELHQKGESSAMGAARAAGEFGPMIAGDHSGEHSSGAGDSILAVVETQRGAEKDGDHNGGVGLVARMLTQRLDSATEDAGELGYDLSTPEKSYKLPEYSTSLLDTIPESVEVLGHVHVSPVKSGNCLPRSSEYAGEHSGGTGLPEKRSTASGAPDSEDAEGLGHLIPSSTLLLTTIPDSSDLDNASTSPVKRYKGLSDCIEPADEGEINICMPEKQSKQMQLFQRRESPLSKPTKLWVAERVSWNGGRDFDKAPEDFPVLGDLGDIRYQEEENLVAADSVPQSEEHHSQGIEGVSPVSKELVWNVKGIAGLSSDGQEGKLDEMLGNIVDEKYGERASSSTRVEVDGFKGMRDADSPYEA
jgi:hypothetical protein